MQQLHLDLFEDATRWPRKPYCSDDKTARCIRSLASAIKRPTSRLTPRTCASGSIYDITAGEAARWHGRTRACRRPRGRRSTRERARAHLVWKFSTPRCWSIPRTPTRVLCATCALWRQPPKSGYKQDPGYSGLITKNPAHPLWRDRGPELAYSSSGRVGRSHQLLPKRKPEQIGLGRNVTVFDWLRHYAYRHIRHYKGDIRNYVLWQAHLNNKALERNGGQRPVGWPRGVAHLPRASPSGHGGSSTFRPATPASARCRRTVGAGRRGLWRLTACSGQRTNAPAPA